ncbi:Rz1-like lysis system protein LysC [Enterovibrio norvegicus]|uniref:Rz1-like lysis system protein LysC n=1 Tax=Enterovibrio norvegicus TaxID=188144 RepID=UPI00354D0B93
MLLSGCSATPEPPKVIVKTVTEKLTVPEHLARDCLLPDIPAEGSTNDPLTEYMVRMETALKDCNTDKKAIRQWQSQPPPTP